MSIATLTPSQLRKAADLKEEIAKLETELGQLLGSSAATTGKPAKKGMSAAGKARIAAAQKLRWSKINAGKKATVTGQVIAKATAKPAKKFTMSAAAKKRISEAAKARWAKIKAAKKA